MPRRVRAGGQPTVADEPMWNGDPKRRRVAWKHRQLGGDSGGPLVGRLEPHKWAGIVSGHARHLLGWQYYYNSAKIILEDMNSKPNGFTGKGFQLTNN